MNKNNRRDIYNELGVTEIQFNKSGNKITLKAILDGEEVGGVLLQEPVISYFNKNGENELELIFITVKSEYEGEGIINYLMGEATQLIDELDKVLVINNNSFPTHYLERRGFKIEEVKEGSLFVYGEDYNYTLKNIDSKYFKSLREENLDKIDVKYIEHKLRREREIKKENAMLEIMEELDKNFIKLLSNTDLKLEKIGVGPLFMVDKLKNSINIDSELDFSKFRENDTFKYLNKPFTKHFNPLYGPEDEIIENMATTFKMLNPDSPQLFQDMNETLIRNSLRVLKRLKGNTATLVDLSTLVYNSQGQGKIMINQFSKLTTDTVELAKENAEIASWFLSDYFNERSKTYEHCSGLRYQVSQLTSNMNLKRVEETEKTEEIIEIDFVINNSEEEYESTIEGRDIAEAIQRFLNMLSEGDESF